MKIIVSAVVLLLFVAETASAGDELLATYSARENYEKYASCAGPKVFVQSMQGAWGWAAETEDAEKDALARCEQHNKQRNGLPCAAINIDGKWINEPSVVSASLQDAYRCSDPAHCFNIVLDSGNPLDTARMHVAMYRLTKMRKPDAGKRRGASYTIDAGNRGLSDLKEGNVESAIALLSEAATSAPTIQEFHIGLGVALLLRHRLAEAEGAFKNALMIAPWSDDAWTGLASVFQLQGKNDKALSALMLAYEWLPNKADAYSRFLKNSQAEDADFMKPRYVEAVKAIALRADALAKSFERYRLVQNAERKNADAGSARANVSRKYIVAPPYPLSSFRKNEQGSVKLRMLIDAEGIVVDSYVEESSGFADLDNAARLALALSKFEPITVDGVQKQGWIRFQYVWRIE